MRRLQGCPISPGFAKGTAVIFDYEVERKLTLQDHSVRHGDVQRECDRIENALVKSKARASKGSAIGRF